MHQIFGHHRILFRSFTFKIRDAPVDGIEKLRHNVRFIDSVIVDKIRFALRRIKKNLPVVKHFFENKRSIKSSRRRQIAATTNVFSVGDRTKPKTRRVARSFKFFDGNEEIAFWMVKFIRGNFFKIGQNTQRIFFTSDCFQFWLEILGNKSFSEIIRCANIIFLSLNNIFVPWKKVRMHRSVQRIIAARKLFFPLQFQTQRQIFVRLRGLRRTLRLIFCAQIFQISVRRNPIGVRSVLRRFGKKNHSSGKNHRGENESKKSFHGKLSLKTPADKQHLVFFYFKFVLNKTTKNVKPFLTFHKISYFYKITPRAKRTVGTKLRVVLLPCEKGLQSIFECGESAQLSAPIYQQKIVARSGFF